jgi:hypothetical protein
LKRPRDFIIKDLGILFFSFVLLLNVYIIFYCWKHLPGCIGEFEEHVAYCALQQRTTKAGKPCVWVCLTRSCLLHGCWIITNNCDFHFQSTLNWTTHVSYKDRLIICCQLNWYFHNQRGDLNNKGAERRKWKRRNVENRIDLMGAGGVTQVWGPEFKPQYYQKNKTKQSWCYLH